MGLGSDMYRQQILDHYKNPVTTGGSRIRRSPTSARTQCVATRFAWTSRSRDDDETIKRVAFSGDGCAISQASASMLSGELAGKSLAELHEMDRDDVIDMLGVDISPMRVKCAVLAEKVAQDGAEIYQGELDVDKTTTED